MKSPSGARFFFLWRCLVLFYPSPPLFILRVIEFLETLRSFRKDPSPPLTTPQAILSNISLFFSATSPGLPAYFLCRACSYEEFSFPPEADPYDSPFPIAEGTPCSGALLRFACLSVSVFGPIYLLFPICPFFPLPLLSQASLDYGTLFF